MIGHNFKADVDKFFFFFLGGGGVLFMFFLCYVHENWEMFFLLACCLEHMEKNK